MDDLAPPRQNQAARRLAADNQRVMRFVQSLPTHAEELFRAALEDNWAEVRRLGNFLATSSDVYGLDHVSEAARQLGDVCDSQHRREAKRRLLRLVGSFPDATSATNW